MAGDEPPLAGKTLPRIGSYDLIQPLGTGGMSSVFRARHLETGLEVAIKVLPRTLAKNPTVLQRFLREAKSAEALEHPNIVAIYDRGLDQGRHYLVLEYVSGGDLHDRVRSSGPLSVEQATSIVRAVSGALRYAAGRGLIHRDIKPANVLLDATGQVKVADLGLALQAEAEDERVTREGTTVGTVDYMAPEQARDSRATSIRSDIYSLGCMFYFLLSGQPPYPGGDVAEKLNRHINASPPDIRELRPEVPAALSDVIRKMLAKKPEQRFGDYDELIAAIDRAQSLGGNGSGSGSGATLTALFDDDDDDAGLAPVDDGFVPLKPAPPPPARRATTRETTPLALADLAELDGPDLLSLPAPRPVKPPAALNRPGRKTPPPPEPADLVPLDDEEDEEDEGPAYIPVAGQRNRPPVATRASSGRGMSDTERSWVMKCALLGLGLILLVIAVDQLIRASKNDTPTVSAETVEAPAAAPGPGPAEPVPGAAVAAQPVVGPAPAPVPVPAVVKKAEPKVERPPVVFVEPTDPAPEMVAEPGYGAGVEEKYVPDWARVASPSPGERSVVVRRVPGPREYDVKPSLHAAFEVASVPVVELADNGPFFEGELRLPGEGRVIRGRAGYRPIVALPRLETKAAQSAAAWLDLGEKSFTLEGVDLVVDVGELPTSLPALFAVRGGTLTFRNCTLTVVNRARSSRPFTVVKTSQQAAGKPSRVLFDRTYVRVACTSLVELSGGPAEVVVVRSVLANGQGTFLATQAPAAAPGAARRVSVARSIVATGGPAIELSDTLAGTRPQPVVLRALGSSFGHFQSAAGMSLVVAGSDTGGTTSLLDWQGDANIFAGWTGLLVAGPSRTVRLANLAAVKSTWPGTEAASEEQSRSWPPPSPSPERAELERFRGVAPSRLAVLTRVATPGPTVLEQTVEEFPRPYVPGPAATVALPAAAAPPPATAKGAGRHPQVASPSAAAPTVTSGRTGRMATSGLASEMPGAAGLSGRPMPMGGAGQLPGMSEPSPLGLAAAIPGTRELSFDTEASLVNGDLGRFIAEKAQTGDKLVRVRVKGLRQHRWSAVRLPDGVSLEVVVEPGVGGAVPSWSAQSGPADALIDVRGGSLLLSGVRLSRDGSASLKRLVRVENGHLALHRCWLSAPGTVETGGGGLIGFHAPGTGPQPARMGGSTWPFDVPVDRPICRVIDTALITGGNPLTAELGRGRVALTHCAVVSETSAFTLLPGKVARSRFDADLLLDRCTVACDQDFVSLGPWRGHDPGPDRPWLVSTVDCAFFGNYERSDQTSVLLRSDAEALAHGALFWQSHGDALEVACFVLTGDAGIPAGRKPDVRTQWVAFWGEHHARNVTGPRLATGQPSRRPLGRLRPHEVDAPDLAVDPDYPAGRRPPAIGVDLTRLGIPPHAGRRR